MKTQLVIAVVLSLAPAVAVADDAQEHNDRATRAYNVQDWTTALREYKAAYEIEPKPDTLWAIAQTQRLSGDCRSAVLTYRAYMRGASSAGANAAEQWIQQCQATIEAQQRAADDVMKQPAPVTPAPAPQPAPQPAPTPVQHKPEAPRSAWADPLGDTLGVLSVAALVGGGYFLLSGNSDMSAAASKPTYQMYTKAVDDARSEQNTGTYALIGGGVLAGLAVWRFVAVATRHDNATIQAFTPVPVPGGAVVTYGGSF
ncbi:MAG TPA: hypothetical protein VMJ10_11805 [Kofleriaceae bacterium]|nr:hypothetical protein [Kofleriaceae bacterium]